MHPWGTIQGAELSCVAMSWNRGLVRICIVVTAIWIVIVVGSLAMGCFDSPLQRVCDFGADWFGVPVDKTLSDFGAMDWISWMQLAALPPLALATLGYAVAWLGRGFSKTPSPRQKK